MVILWLHDELITVGAHGGEPETMALGALAGPEMLIPYRYRGGTIMIKLTKFNSDNKKGEFVLNAEVIETIEQTPDTVITLTNGKKLIVEEPMDECVRRVMVYRRALHKY